MSALKKIGVLNSSSYCLRPFYFITLNYDITIFSLLSTFRELCSLVNIVFLWELIACT